MVYARRMSRERRAILVYLNKAGPDQQAVKTSVQMEDITITKRNQ